MGQPDYIFGQFQETARCRYAQHGDRVCCALAPQLVIIYNHFYNHTAVLTCSFLKHHNFLF